MELEQLHQSWTLNVLQIINLGSADLSRRVLARSTDVIRHMHTLCSSKFVAGLCLHQVHWYNFFTSAQPSSLERDLATLGGLGRKCR